MVRRSLLPLVVLCLLATIVSCQKGADRECDSFFPSCPLGLECDLGTYQCVDMGCGECSADKPVCEPVTKLCVQCVGTGPQDACGSQLCDKNVCKACVEDVDCPDGLCLRNGSCPKAADIAFATAAGTANAECSRTTPCTLPAALATGRPYLHVRGNHTVPATLQITRTVRIYGPLDGTRPKISVSAAGPVFEVSGNVTLDLRDVELTGATGAEGHGILVRSGAPTLDLETVDIIGNAGLGISAGGAALKLTFGLVVGNAGGGISAAGRVELENNIIAGNGSTASAVGGVRLTSSGTSSVVRFNTIAANLATAGVGSGVACAAAQQLSSNIFAGNTMTTCTAIYSLFPVGTTVPGTGNKAGDPQFLGTTLPANRDDETYYHLAATSPAAASGEPLPSSQVISDIDGDGRIANREIGADELR